MPDDSFSLLFQSLLSYLFLFLSFGIRSESELKKNYLNNNGSQSKLYFASFQ